jgi:hypothetical protein
VGELGSGLFHRQEGPPAHWVELVREAAPELLDPSRPAPLEFRAGGPLPDATRPPASPPGPKEPAPGGQGRAGLEAVKPAPPAAQPATGQPSAGLRAAKPAPAGGAAPAAGAGGSRPPRQEPRWRLGEVRSRPPGASRLRPDFSTAQGSQEGRQPARGPAPLRGPEARVFTRPDVPPPAPSRPSPPQSQNAGLPSVEGRPRPAAQAATPGLPTPAASSDDAREPRQVQRGPEELSSPGHHQVPRPHPIPPGNGGAGLSNPSMDLRWPLDVRPSPPFPPRPSPVGTDGHGRWESPAPPSPPVPEPLARRKARPEGSEVQAARASEDRWPSLPEPEPDDGLTVERVLQAWEHNRRLALEQMGEQWNGSPS